MAGEFPPFLETAPIFFVSTHGAYILKKETRPFLVPQHTIIIDTVDIGEVCLTGIDKPLWKLIQGVNRAKFISYMKGIPDPTDSEKDQENYLRIFNNVHVYFPGDPIYSRALSIGPEKRNEYKNMGFFKFKVGAPENVFNNSNNVFKQSGVKSKILRPLERELVIHDEKMINYEYMLQLNSPELTDSRQRIFIFSSCGVRWAGTHDQIENVQRSQEAARLKFMSMRSETEKFGRALINNTGWSKVPKGLRGEMPEEYAPGAFNESNSNNEGVYFETRSRAMRQGLEPSKRKSIRAPVNGIQLFYQKPGLTEYVPLHQDDGTLYYTPSQVNIMKKRLPDIKLYKLVKGAFVPLRGGGRQTRKKKRT
jgi:hypothetical protein